MEAAGERLRVDAVLPGSDEPPQADVEEHARRLLDVLTLADAIPARPTPSSADGASALVPVTPLTLAQRVLAIESSLSDLPHAFGGALALAYYAEPRATIDIDLNVFVPTDRFAEVAGPLVRLGAPADDPTSKRSSDAMVRSG